MDPYAIESLIAFGAITVTGFLSGLIKRKWVFAATLVTWGTAVGYVVLLAVVGGWVAACPHCESNQSGDASRGFDLYMAIFYGAFFAAVIVAFTKLGEVLASLIARQRRLQ